MRTGIIGTGAIAAKHAEAYRNLGFEIVACTNRQPDKGHAFAEQVGARFVASVEELARSPDIEMLDVCTLPYYRLEAVELAAAAHKHILVEKPIATTPEIARKMMAAADAGGVRLGVVSQHRFDDSIVYLKKAIDEGHLGRLLQADAYVKWYRSPDYYSRAAKGSWDGEGGGALINQAIHSLDMLLFLAGSIVSVCGMWQLGARHAIEAEDIVNALLRFSSGATGVVQAATAFWPGEPERLEIHGTDGSVVITGDQITAWSLHSKRDNPPPRMGGSGSGAADPMAISTLPLERQIEDFARACRTGGPMVNSAAEGLRTLEAVAAIYQSCRSGRPFMLDPNPPAAQV